jgi:hypothetical protein
MMQHELLHHAQLPIHHNLARLWPPPGSPPHHPELRALLEHFDQEQAGPIQLFKAP